MGRARLFLAREKGLRQQERTHGADSQQQIHAGRNRESLALWSQPPSVAQTPFPDWEHTWTQRNTSRCGPQVTTQCAEAAFPFLQQTDFPSPPIRIELQNLSVLSFFFSPPLKKKKKPKPTTKVLASICPKAGRQDRMWENCHHLLPKYQPSTGAAQTAGMGTARNSPDHHDVPLPSEELAVLVLVAGQGALLR